MSIFYGIYLIINTKNNIEEIRDEYLIDLIKERTNKDNLKAIEDAENRIKTASIVYIDKNFNTLNRTIENRVKRIIQEIK